MKRLLVCFDKRELYNAKAKGCLEKLSDLFSSLTAKGHVVVVLPLININSMKNDLENIFLFESELSIIIIKNSLLFADNYGRFSNPLLYIPRAIKELKIFSKHVMIVDNWQARLEEAINLGYITIRVPGLESPVYEKYINKIEETTRILSIF